MSDPFSRNDQALTDALLQLDQAITTAEANVAAARQLGLPEAQDLAMRLPYLVDRARRFLASIPDMGQPQRWGESRRLLDQARAFAPFFAPYLALSQRVTSYRQALQDQANRSRAAADQAERQRLQQETGQALDVARRRLSVLRQTYADMQMQRGSGFDHQEWTDALRSVGSILSAQDTRMAAALSSMRSGDFATAQQQLDQTIGELQGGLDVAQRARTAAAARAQDALRQRTAAGNSGPLATLQRPVPTPQPSPEPVAPVARPTALLLIESRSGTLFRIDRRSLVLGRGLVTPSAPGDPYVDLSRACDPGEAEYLGVSRRHAELAYLDSGFNIRDLGSTNGTRLRHPGEDAWTALLPQQWAVLRDGDTVQFGLLECRVAIS